MLFIALSNLKRLIIMTLILLGLSVWSVLVFHSGRLIGSTQTLEYQARISNELLGIDQKTLTTYLDSARFILRESSWSLIPIRE